MCQICSPEVLNYNHFYGILVLYEQLFFLTGHAFFIKLRRFLQCPSPRGGFKKALGRLYSRKDKFDLR